MASSSSTSSSSSIIFLPFSPLHRKFHLHRHLAIVTAPSRARSPLLAYRKPPNYPQDAVVVAPDPRAWIGDENEDDDDDDDDDEEEEEEDRSLDLFVRFVENIFRKISRRARKAVRSVLPPSISTKLVRFSVNGVLILAFLWILKAFLEVVCTLGSMVFVSILLVRGVWSSVSYVRDRQYYRYVNRMDDDDNSAWTGTQPAT